MDDSWVSTHMVALSALIITGLNSWNRITNAVDSGEGMVIQVYGYQFNWITRYSGADNQLNTGLNKLSCYFPESFLQSGQYFLSLFIIKNKKKAIFIERDILNFVVVDASREIGVYMGREPGYIRPQFEWEKRN